MDVVSKISANLVAVNESLDDLGDLHGGLAHGGLLLAIGMLTACVAALRMALQGMPEPIPQIPERLKN
jgi:hypothetical protein